jgi:hypothetical protein
MLGEANQNLSVSTTFAVGANARAVAVGDLNEDKVPDIVVASTTLLLFLSNP